jgi:hypothetical protein
LPTFAFAVKKAYVLTSLGKRKSLMKFLTFAIAAASFALALANLYADALSDLARAVIVLAVMVIVISMSPVLLVVS